jgi:hypothetical protein
MVLSACNKGNNSMKSAGYAQAIDESDSTLEGFIRRPNEEG